MADRLAGTQGLVRRGFPTGNIEFHTLMQRHSDHRTFFVTPTILPLMLLCMVWIAGSGCVRRRMTVRTSPPGATVSIDNQLIGTSPAATDFIYYGTREVRIEREGYRTEVVLKKMKPPWYQLPVLDFVSETLWPGEIRDERIIDIELVPQVIEPSEDVLNRAEALRNQSRGGMVPSG